MTSRSKKVLARFPFIRQQVREMALYWNAAQSDIVSCPHLEAHLTSLCLVQLSSIATIIPDAILSKLLLIISEKFVRDNIINTRTHTNTHVD